MVLRQSLTASLLLLGMCLVWNTSIQAQSGKLPSKKEMKLITSCLEGEVAVELLETGPDSARFEGLIHPGDHIYLVRNGEERAYLLSTRAMGRYDYFDYASLWTREAVLQKVAVTVYRSNHGAAICQKKWLSQFENYQGESLQLGKDVDAVSGGTLSATSLVEDLKRSHALIAELLSSN